VPRWLDRLVIAGSLGLAAVAFLAVQLRPG
jgi:hypothetical protein